MTTDNNINNPDTTTDVSSNTNSTINSADTTTDISSNTTDNKKKFKTAKKKKGKTFKKVLKVILIILFILIILIILPMQTTTYKTLRNGHWNLSYNTISFDKYFHFAYYDVGAGSPVGDSDLYPFYIYLGNSTFVTLGISPIKVGKIHHIDDRCLLLTYDGETLLFYNENAFEDGDNLVSYNDYSSCENCFSSSTGLDSSYIYCNIANINDKSITISPYEFYNKEENKTYSYTFDLTDSINYDYSKQESELIDEYTMYTHTCKSKNISKKEAISLLKDASLKAYVKFNNKGTISDLIVVDSKATILELSTLQRTKIEREIAKREEENLEEDLTESIED